MAGNEVQITVTSRDRTKAGFGSAERGAKGLKNTMADVGRTAAGFLAANVVSAGFQKFQGFIRESIEASKNLGESQNAVTKVFGKSAGEIERFSQRAAKEVGLSARAFNEMATPLGAMLKNAGLGMGVVTDSTIDLTQRASDMASVFNTDVSTALEAIQAGLRGESDPLEKFGVGLSAVKVEAEAMAMSGKKNAKALTDQEKMLARVNLIMKQTKDTAGDFKDTSDGLANSTRIQAAQTEDLQAKIGTKMVPAMLAWNKAKLALVKVLVDRVLPAMFALGGWIDRNRGLVQYYASIVGGVLVAAFVAWAGAAAAAAVATIAATWPVIAIGAAIGLLALGFMKAWKASEKFRVVVATVLKIVGQAFLRYVDIWLMGFEKVFHILGKLPGKAGAAFRAAEKATQMARQKVAEYKNALDGLPAKVRTQVLAFTDDALAKIRRVNRELAGIPAYKLTRVRVEQAYGMSIGALKRATGGPIGAVATAASGGARGSMTLVGEQGPELVRLPFGSMVKPAGQTRSMLGGGGGPARVVLEINSGGSRMDDLLVEVLRKAVRARGGDVQVALGR